ncbi:hypothetical protein G6F65_022745 [Rhizopus arrhizus]|nr:hypothetical protein G6F65_022745 [Rhizopus arrhizus]
MSGLHALEERRDLVARHEGAGRIVGVGDEQQARVVGDGVEHGVQVVAVVLRRHDDVARATRLRGQAIHRERVLCIHRRRARLQQRQRGDLEDVRSARAAFRSKPLGSG